jgi:uncharacterized membrane protein
VEVSLLPAAVIGKEPPLVLVVLVLVALLVLLVTVRVVRAELRPSEIERFRAATALTNAWSRGEELPPAYPQGDDQPTDRQGLSRSSRT